MEKQKLSRAKPKGRVFGNDFTFIHDLYKLDLAHMKKDMATQGNAPFLQNVEHVHFYHSFDSTGRKQVKSTMIGGHFHEVTVISEGDDENPPRIKVGPAVKYVSVRNKRTKRVEKRIQPLAMDEHTHDVTYLRSDKLKPRKVSDEFVKFQSKVDTPKAQVDGIL